MLSRALVLTVGALILVSSSIASASVISTFYGDDDGFGVGQTAGNLTAPNTSHAGVGEAPLTDVRLIATGFAAPPFTPLGSFGAFALDGPILSATLTLRTGAFDSGPNPIEAPNVIVLDGVTVGASFINGFSQLDSSIIETRAFALPASFFSLLADGAVSLSGTRITEDLGSQSFQIDFLRLDIVTTTVPEPGTLALLALALASLTLFRRVRTTRVRGVS